MHRYQVSSGNVIDLDRHFNWMIKSISFAGFNTIYWWFGSDLLFGRPRGDIWNKKH